MGVPMFGPRAPRELVDMHSQLAHATSHYIFERAQRKELEQTFLPFREHQMMQHAFKFAQLFVMETRDRELEDDDAEMRFVDVLTEFARRHPTIVTGPEPGRDDPMAPPFPVVPDEDDTSFQVLRELLRVGVKARKLYRQYLAEAN